MPVVEISHRRDKRDLCTGELARTAPLLEFLGFLEDFHGEFMGKGLWVRGQESGVRKLGVRGREGVRRGCQGRIGRGP